MLLSFQQLVNSSTYILQRENQFLDGGITNLNEKISKTQIIGFGIWFKWQPETLSDISNTNDGCNQQFIFSLENTMNKQSIIVLYLTNNKLEHQLKIWSDFFIFQEEIWFRGQFEGVWIYFDSFFDYNTNYTTLYMYKSFTQELTQYKIDGIPMIQDQLHYQIGKICDQCVIQNFVDCFTRFEGRLSFLILKDNFDESTYLNNIEDEYSLVNDCVEKNLKLIIGSQIFDKNFDLSINLGILEKLYFQLKGWVKVFDEQTYMQMYIIRLFVLYKHNSGNYILSQINRAFEIYYNVFLSANMSIIQIYGVSEYKFEEGSSIVGGELINFDFSLMKQWHYVQLDVGYTNQTSSFKIFSHQSKEIIISNFLFRQSTGIKYVIDVGLDFGSQMPMISKLKISLNNLVFQSFCKPLEQEYSVMCHYTCQTCFGPFFDNCLSCKSSSRRFLNKNQCICDSGTLQFQEYEICQTINDIYKNLIIIEEELPCKLEGYDRCDDLIICSFGYFKYQGKYCIQCPYYNNINTDSQILCSNCLIEPDEFSITLTCTIDTIQQNYGEQSTYDNVLRNYDAVESFKISLFQDKHQLQLIKNKTQINSSNCGSNCLKCEIKKDQLNCQQCPQKYYLKNQQCFECGQFCADCMSNRYCNYCIDSQKYFISSDRINCLICNIPNCKYCYQVFQIDNLIFYTTFNFNLENLTQQKQSVDNKIYCAKCNEEYILDLNTNTCIKRFDQDTVCQFGLYNQLNSQILCQSSLSQVCLQSDCKYCLIQQCIECQIGYYVDFQGSKCLKCPVSCENCVFQNKKLMDNWKYEILERYDKIFLFQKLDILSKIKDDYEIQCTSCLPNYLLYNKNCIEGCNNECSECKIVRGQAKCVQCKPYGQLSVSSINSNGQCLRCQKNCQLCLERSIKNLEKINSHFIQNQENSIYTRSCYKLFPSINERKKFIYQLTVIDCGKYNKCKRKGIFTWNIYCDIQEFQNKSGFINEGHYYFKDFFEKDILSQVKIIYQLLNEEVIEQIDIIINIFQGNVNSCKPSNTIENIIKIHSDFIFNIFFQKEVNFQKLQDNLKMSFQKDLFLIYQDFNQLYLKIQTLKLIKQISLILKRILQLLQVVYLELIFLFQHSFHITLIQQINDNTIYQDIKILIQGLRIINSKFQNIKLINIITEIGPKASCQFNNIYIIETQFNNSTLLSSSTSSGLKNMFFGNFTITDLKINNVILENSILISIPNLLQLKINSLIIQYLKLQSNSYFILSNQLNCFNCSLNEVSIDKSFLFSNNLPLLYQTSFGNLINIYFNYFTFENVVYNQVQSLLQVIKYTNHQVIVNLNYIRIDQASSILIEQKFLSEEISLIYISCSQCYLNQIYINRKNGIPEISLLDSDFIIISNSFFTQDKKQAQDIIQGCQNKISNSLPQFIYVGKYKNIKIDNLTIFDSISFNYPFIIFKGIEIIERQIDESIEITDSIFQNNKLITSKSNSPTSIIQINSRQQTFINLSNLQFQDNHLNMQIQDLITQSASTLLIDTQFGKIIINKCLFQQNIVTNSTDSTLYIKAQVVQFISSKFIRNNILNFQNLFKRIQLNSIGYRLKTYDLYQAISVLSNGGSGYLLTNHLSFEDCSVQESYSLSGGAFYIETFGQAEIQILNSTFTKTSTSLQNSASQNGGCFYIDAQASQLTLLVKNSIFNQSYSRSEGGCFFIVPSNSYNYVYVEQITVINSFSTTSQFFEFSIQNQKNIISNVTFCNIRIFYDQIAFYQFLGLLDNLSSDEASTMVNDAPIIKIQYGNVTMDKIYCQLGIQIFLASINQGSNINLNQIYIENGFIRNSPLFYLNLKSGQKGLLKIQNVKIYNLLEYQEINDFKICEKIDFKNTLEQFCISPVIVSQNLHLEENTEIIQQITSCQNSNLLLTSEKLKFSLIVFSNVKINHKIIIQDMFLNQIICRNCQNGLISFINIDENKENNILLDGIIIQNSQCGITGCFTIINKNSNNYLKTNYLKQGDRILQEQNFESLKFAFNFQVSLSNSKFIQNVADYGAAVCIIDINILIHQSYFLKNIAKVGGAIYSFTSLQQNFITNIFASFFFENQAELAANIYLENQMLPQIEKLNVIMENNSTIQETSIFESPRSLALLVNKGSIFLQKKIVLSTLTKVIERTIIQPYTTIGLKEKVQTLMFPSGQMIGEYQYFDISTSTNIPYNLSFRIIGLNKLNQKVNQLNGSICTLKHQVINITNQFEIDDLFAKLSINQISFDTSTQDFNLDNLIVYFNPYYDKEIVLRIFIQCDMVQIPIYDKNPPFPIINFITDYTLFVDIKTFPCQLGEYFNSTSKICIQCNSDQSQYQVQQNATICSIKDETKIKSVESEKIELRPNFWRAYFYSTKIEECYHLLENCLGGWQPGDQSCAYGHIGALCEQCDLYNIRGDGHFSTSSPFKCGSCDKIEGNIISILLISVWTLISVLMSVNSTIDTINQYIAQSKLSLFGVSSLSKQSSTAVLIKVFTNYLQIIQTITTFQLKVPSDLSSIFTSVGNPMEQMAYSLDCFLMSISDISIIYFRIIWSFLMAFTYISSFFLFLAGAKLLKQIKFNISMITTALIYIFIFLQPNIIQSLISLVSFRVLSNIAWIQGNVAYRYDTTSHQFWMITFCLPILLTFSALIPLFMFQNINRNRYQLEQIKTRETWGYLYNEYKLKAYYWEFIKIFQKELIIIFLAYYEDFIAIKASLVFLVIFAYSFISTSVQPYMTGELNRFDAQSTTVCAVSIILGSSIYTAQNQNFIEIVYPFYIIIALLNGWFLLKMIFYILQAYFDKLNDKIDNFKEKISQKFPNFVKKYPLIKKFLESKITKLKRIQSRFAMIKQFLMPQAKKILKLKNEIQIDMNSDLLEQKVDKPNQINSISTNEYLKKYIYKQKQKIYPEFESQRELQDQLD